MRRNTDYLLFGIHKYFGALMFLSCLFFYVSPFKNGFDTQPYSILITTAYVFFCIVLNYKLPNEFIILIFLLFAIAIIAAIDAILFSSPLGVIRGFLNYYAAIIYLISFYIYLTSNKFPVKLFKFSLLLYIIIAIIQQFINPDVVSNFVALRTSLDRGVTSLTPEPTFFGIVLYLMLLIVYLNNSFSRGSKTFLAFLIIMSIVLLAKSSMVFVFLFCFLVSMIRIKKLFIIFLYILVFCFVFFIFNDALIPDNTRLYSVLNMIYKLDFKLILSDPSINDRVSQVYYAFYGLLDNNLLPGMFGSFSYYMENKNLLSDGLFWYGEPGNKIISYWGTWFYELGAFTFLYILFLSLFLKRSKYKFFALFSLIIPLFGGITVSNPLVYIVIVLLALNGECGKKKIGDVC